MRRAVVAVLPCAVLAAGGCGPLSKHEYVTRGDRICRQIDARQAELGAADDVRSRAVKGARVVSDVQSFRERLGKLKAPNELKVPVRTYLIHLDRRLALQRRAVAAAQRGDAAAARRAAVRAQRIGSDLQAASRRVGFKVCGKR
jgi:hypothetical protein